MMSSTHGKLYGGRSLPGKAGTHYVTQKFLDGLGRFGPSCEATVNAKTPATPNRHIFDGSHR